MLQPNSIWLELALCPVVYLPALPPELLRLAFQFFIFFSTFHEVASFPLVFKTRHSTLTYFDVKNMLFLFLVCFQLILSLNHKVDILLRNFGMFDFVLHCKRDLQKDVNFLLQK